MCNTTKGCCPCTSQFLLAVINFISFLVSFLGFIVIACIKFFPFEQTTAFILTLIEMKKEEDAKELLEYFYELFLLDKLLLSTLIIVAVMMSLSILGFISAVTGNRCFLIAYMSIAVLILLVHSGLFIAFFFDMSFIFSSLVKKQLNTSADILTNHEPNSTIYKNYLVCGVFLTLSKTFECCGVAGVSDFQNKTFYSEEAKQEVNSLECCEYTDLNTSGCASAISNQLGNYSKNIVIEYIIFNSVTSVFQIALILLAVLVLVGVIKRLNKNKRTKRYMKELRVIKQKEERENRSMRSMGRV